ncbi:hypothetical protein GmHk_18G051871 [Glycine max]|nr:hypothetical protein GmHk_18G051871 [Glycine max]
MSPPPLEPHNHSQTHFMLSGWLPLQAQFSASLRTTKALNNSLKLGPFSLYKSLNMQKLRELPKNLFIYDFRLK